MTFNRETIQRHSAYFLFWSWHVIYLIVVLSLVLPFLLIPMISSAIAGEMPPHYTLYSLFIFILPFVSMYFGARYFQSNYRRLMKYFYGFEMPLLFFLIVRMVTLREEGFATPWLMLNIAIALGTWLTFLIVQQRNEAKQHASKPTASDNQAISINHKVPCADNWFAMTGSITLGLVGLYFGLLFLILTLPFLVDGLMEIAKSLQYIDFFSLLDVLLDPLALLALTFFLFTSVLLLLVPLSMIYLYISQFVQRLPTMLTPLRLGLIATVIAVNVGVLTLSTQQPQQAVFEQLESETVQQGKPDEATMRALSAQHATIREGLLNAYLARYRYLSTTASSQSIKYYYKDVFSVSDSVAEIPQQAFNWLLTPFFYDGKDWRDADKAERYYAAFFDQPIQKAETAAILKSVRHNWDAVQGNEAGLLDTLNQHVHLDAQDISIEASDAGVATVTVQQTLRNITNRPKETVLHFSLPEDAALTGVWLSDNAEDPEKYPYVLSPKGAAQAVYKAEVNRRVDPALLEQTGPYQYRLRVYPVPPNSDNTPDTNLMHVRFNYQVLSDQAGNWPMPEVLEQRNLFWDEKTQYSLNGKNTFRQFNGFPPAIPALTQKTAPESLRFNYGKQQLHAIPRTPLKETLPQHGHFAILVDGSYSMREYHPVMLRELEALQRSKATFKLYFCQLSCKPFSPGAIDDSGNLPQEPPFFGDSQMPDHLRAFSQRPEAGEFDALFMLSDRGSYELSRGKGETTAQEQLRLTMPLWLVHMGDLLPYAYDDQVLDHLYRSGGGVTRSLAEALKRYTIIETRLQYEQASAQNNTTLISISEQRLWFAEPVQPATPDDVATDTTDDAATTPPSAIAAAHWIRHLGQTADTEKLETLDKIHELAKAEHIVTHYSSMLVLVDDRQREALKKAEQQDDRFDREVETGKQATSKPADILSVPAVPEPEEWALLLIVLSLLSFAWWRRRQAEGFHA